MTLGLGSDGLAVKLGTSEKIYLEDILEIDQSVKLDDTNTYYWAEDGNTDIDFFVNNVTTTIDNATLHTEKPVIRFADLLAQAGLPADASLPIGNGWTHENRVDGMTVDFVCRINNIQTDIKELEKLHIQEGTKVSLALKLETSPNVNMRLTKATNLKITMPKYLHIQSVTRGTFEGHVITIPSFQPHEGGKVCDVTVDRIDLDGDGVVNGQTQFSLPVEKTVITMDGTFLLTSNGSFTATGHDEAKVAMDIVIGDGAPGQPTTITLDKVRGRFDPAINPSLNSIDIFSALPDFLQDPEVVLNVANPTLKFTTDMQQIPMALEFRSELTAQKEGADGFSKTVSLPKTGYATLHNERTNHLYFAGMSQPYDPDGVTPGATTHTIDNLGSLIENIPDRIDVNLSDRKIRVKDEPFTIELGRTYHSNLKYSIFAPFQFNTGLKIVYRDSTNCMNADLKDYQAEGLAITATAVSTLPLGLVVSAYPLDTDGNKIPTIALSEVAIPASNGSTEASAPITLAIKLNDPKDLQRVDRLHFRIQAAADANAEGKALNARQFLQLKDIRLRLTGQVIGDFN
ncbi:MAG: hypothetical protein PUI86_02770 [Bacteroidales bacterium]|nr:hypothetical protein [Bacteroidales bacterium]